MLRRRKRNYEFVRGKDRMLARVERDVGAWGTSKVGNIVIQKVGCGVFAMIHMD